MRVARMGALWAWSLVSVGLARAQQRSRLDDQFRELIASRQAAIARADTAVVHSQVADELWWVIGATGGAVNRSQFLEAVSRVQSPRPRFEIDSVHTTALGDVVAVTYRRTDHRKVGAYEMVNGTRVLEVFVRRRGRWLLTHHAQTWIVQSSAAIALDSATLDSFIGRYEIGPGYVDNVHREGSALVATATGQTEGATLVPVSETAFSPDGAGPLMVFERDAAGRILGYVQGLADGQIVRARRIQ